MNSGRILVVVVWLVVMAYPALTGFSGKDRLLLAFPPTAILAGLTLSRVHDTVFPLAESRGLAASWTDSVPGSSQRVEEPLVVGFFGLLALSVGITAVDLSAERSETISEQAATVMQIGDHVKRDAYLLTYKNHLYYHSDGIEPAQTFIGYPYSDPLAEGIVRDLDRQRVEYVIIPADWVNSDGTIERRGL